MPLFLLSWLTRLRTAIDAPRLWVGRPGSGPRRARGARGQATTEYALVLLAAALVALLVVAWATSGGGAAKIGQLFDRVIDSVIGRA